MVKELPINPLLRGRYGEMEENMWVLQKSDPEIQTTDDERPGDPVIL